MHKLKQLLIASSLFLPSACGGVGPPVNITYNIENIQNYVKKQLDETDEIKNFTIKTLEFDENKKPIVKTYEYTGQKGIAGKKYVFFDPQGTPHYDYYTERSKNNNLTPDEYISTLSKIFNSPARWEAFTNYFMTYTHDSPDEKNELLPGTVENHKDYWQSPEETVLRVNHMGQAIGDCDDFSFLIQKILEKQGQKSFVVSIPRHAITLWLTQDKKTNKHHAYSIDTFGYDHNGNRYGENPNPTKTQGYDTPLEAINSIFKKYPNYDKKTDYQTSKDTITTLSIGKNKEHVQQFTPLSQLITNEPIAPRK